MKRISVMLAAFVIFVAGCKEDNTPPPVQDPFHPVVHGKEWAPQDYLVKYCSPGDGNLNNENCVKVQVAYGCYAGSMHNMQDAKRCYESNMKRLH